MTTTADQVFARGLDVFDAVVADMAGRDWDQPSACEGWTARDVLGHVGQIAEVGIEVFAGRPPRPPSTSAQPGESVEGDPAVYWFDRSTRVRAGLDGVDLSRVVDSTVGPRTMADGLAFPAIDLFVHAWDIARVSGSDVVIPDDVIEFAHAHLDPIPDERKRTPELFGPAVEPPADATPTEAFLAWTGRPPRR